LALSFFLNALAAVRSRSALRFALFLAASSRSSSYLSDGGNGGALEHIPLNCRFTPLFVRIRFPSASLRLNARVFFASRLLRFLWMKSTVMSSSTHSRRVSPVSLTAFVSRVSVGGARVGVFARAFYRRRRVRASRSGRRV